MVVRFSPLEMNGRKQDLEGVIVECWVLHKEHYVGHMKEQKMRVKVG
jgi:hypothetical protein